jgi:hypothetical protein
MEENMNEWRMWTTPLDSINLFLIPECRSNDRMWQSVLAWPPVTGA